jgi:hypothetical protein
MSQPESRPLDIDPPYRPKQPDDVTSAAELLWPVVSLPIVEAKFAYSRTAKAYRPFGQSDLKFITDALAYDEENEL